MQPRAVAATIVALGLAFTIAVWMGRASRDPIEVDAAAKPKVPSEDEKPNVVETGPKPKAVFEVTEYDFGTMKFLSSGSHTFIVRNDGKGPLELKAGPTTCQCTIGELADNVIAPGESTEVELTWTIKIPDAVFEHSAEIWTNDPENPSVDLKIGGFVGRDLMVKPEAIWNFGSISKIESAKFEGMIFSDLHSKMELLSVSVDSDNFSAEFKKLSAKDIQEMHRAGYFSTGMPGKEPPSPASGYQVTVTLIKEIPVGAFSQVLEFTAKLDDTLGEVKQQVSLSGTKTGAVDFFALPGATWVQSLMLVQAGTVNATKGKTASVMMFVRGGEEEFKVTAVEKDLSWINVTTETKEKVGNADRVQLNIEFPPDCPKTFRTLTMPAKITLKTNHPEAAEITVKLAFISE